MLGKLKSRFLATSVSVAALTVGMAFAQPGQKASAQVAGVGSTAAADLYNAFGANYGGGGSGTCSSGTDAGFDFCGTDIPFPVADGFTETPVANLRIEAPVDPAVGVTGLDQGTVCSIYAGAITNWSELGGPDEPIVVVYRNGGITGSGTAYIINNNCGTDGSGAPNAIPAGSTGDVINAVQSTPGAIGYAEQANVNAAGATTALSGPFRGSTYAIYSNGNSSASDFINNIINNPDQVSGLGYDPI